MGEGAHATIELGPHVYQRILDECRKSFIDPPRQFDDDEIKEFRVPQPEWMKKDFRPALQELWRNEMRVFREGAIVWGQVVQAHPKLYLQGTIDYPAALIYSRDAYFDGNPGELSSIAEALGNMKGSRQDHPQMQLFADMMREEREVQLNMALPRPLTKGKAVTYTTVLVFRKHLPVPLLVLDLVPLVIHPKLQTTWILPSRWWPQELLDMWFAAAR